MASCSNFLLTKVLFLQANGQQTTVSVEPWLTEKMALLVSDYLALKSNLLQFNSILTYRMVIIVQWKTREVADAAFNIYFLTQNLNSKN